MTDFRAEVRFESGHLLDILDNFLIEPSRNNWHRNFAYYFGVPNDPQRERIFLFDCHGQFGAEPHLDLDDGERLFAGDPRLNGFSPRDIEIRDVLAFVDLYFDQKPFPWVAA